MTKFHFAAMIGVDFELDIFDHWIEYYKAMKFDSYKIFLHRQRGGIADSIIRLVRDYGVEVECVDGSHADGRLRGELCKHHASKLDADDFFITADGDEYHTVPGYVPGKPTLHPVAPDYRLLEKHYDMIMGFMVDRHADSLEVCTRNPFEQYPYEEEFTGDVQKTVTPHFIRNENWHHTRRTKVLAARAGYDVAYEGSHLMRETPSNARIAEFFRVIHFAWRKSAAEKIAYKSYYTIENLDEIYGGRAPDDIREILLSKHPDRMMCAV